jgi:crossover junction endodeoxyribonuclease RusA
MTEISFFVHGIPKAQPRPRAFARKLGNGKFIARTYEAGTAEAWKSAVANAVRRRRPRFPLDGPLRVDITFHFPRPKSHLRGNAQVLREDAPTWHSGRPDRDNLDKAVLDALTQIGMWQDDSQVCCGEIKKLYAVNNAQAGAQITIQKLKRGAYDLPRPRIPNCRPPRPPPRRRKGNWRDEKQ